MFDAPSELNKIYTIIFHTYNYNNIPINMKSSVY